LINFYMSIYYKLVSLDKINAYESNYFGYDSIYQIGGYYLDLPNLVFLGIYAVFFLLFIPINIIYISQYISFGNLRILGCSSVFNSKVDAGIYPLLLFYMIFIIFNIAYYIFMLYSSNAYKTIHDNHASMQDIIYNNIDSNLLKYLNDEHVVDNNIELYQVYDKLNHWAYNGTKEENDARAGNIENSDDMLEKRFKMLVTATLAVHYINNRNKAEIMSESNLSSIGNSAKKSIFLFAKKDTPILPPFGDISRTDIYKVIAGPLLKSKYRKCREEDTSYFCKNKQDFEKNIYKMKQDDLNKLKDKYNKLKSDVNTFVAKIKENDNVMSHKLNIIFASIFLVFYILLIIQIIAWFIWKTSIHSVIITNLRYFSSIFFAYVFLIVAL